MRLLVTGGRGQLGRAIEARGGDAVRAIGSAELDIRDAAQISRAIADHAPSAVINCAAYTKVDQAEIEADQAVAVNHHGAELLAAACRARSIPLVHVSTDYVFGGSSNRPYKEDDPIAPTCVYGSSKAAGEQAVRSAGGLVVRTSWLFGEGGPSFVHTITRLARSQPVLRVVADQRGCPTYAPDLAYALIAIAARAVEGQPLASTYHYCNAGEVTWHGFAEAIVAELRQISPDSVACRRVEAITTVEYPTLAKRPVYSVLDTSRIAALNVARPPWMIGVRRVVAAEMRV